MKRVLGVAVLACATRCANAFMPQAPRSFAAAAARSCSSYTGQRRHMSDGGGEGEAAKAAVKDMKVAEIKAELDLRGVKYDDCFEKSDLVARLERSRAYGRADPSIVDKFNKDLLESRLDPELRDMIKNVDKEQLQDMAAADGSLPGGLSPELMDKMMKNPDLMVMLQNPKMQEIMKSVMQDGPSGMAKYMSDPSALELLQKLTAIMQA